MLWIEDIGNFVFYLSHIASRFEKHFWSIVLSIVVYEKMTIYALESHSFLFKFLQDIRAHLTDFNNHQLRNNPNHYS